MKITYEINLPEEQEIYQNFRDAQAMRTALHVLRQYLRANTKYAPDSMSDDSFQAYKNVQKKFNTLAEGLLDE